MVSSVQSIFKIYPCFNKLVLPLKVNSYKTEIHWQNILIVQGESKLLVRPTLQVLLTLYGQTFVDT